MFSLGRGLTFDDVLLVPAYNGIKSRNLVTTSVKIAGKTFEIPLVSSNMDTITGLEMAKFMANQGGLALLHRFMSIEENVRIFKLAQDTAHVGISIGLGKDGLQRAEALIAAGAEIICVDVAHGHSKEVNRTIRELRENWHQNIMIIAGNVATYAGADYLASAGADVIKVGIGSGSVCTTRLKAGYGVPQLTAIFECSKIDRSIIADGGIRYAGDAVKALAAGADLIMLGGMLSGTDEAPGDFIERTLPDGTKQKLKKFRGMASREAQEDFMGQMQDWKTAEGVATEVLAKGPAMNIVMDIMGGIRSGMTYSGASEIRDLKRKAQFIEITQAGRVESSPHALGRYT
jgi:IMP dehydrogenase